MKIMWCWRCRQEVGMLDEEEYKRIHTIYIECAEKVKTFRKNTGSSLENTPLNDFFKPVCEEYEKITGFSGFNHNAIMHHRISIYGQPCKCCGKPLRTPRAKMCAACGAKVTISDTFEKDSYN
ncbi:hypothetical protein ABCY62_02610 [Acetivibrio clariflavus]|uniref:Uncharacterized protein n=2 Tax=Acetivibrio clariflavus TaxID=288965 RepID=G8LWN0_ACECE|nr:hypothetical protein Clocl_2101 [Acetivibrio clariflavus DSM 19732]